MNLIAAFGLALQAAVAAASPDPIWTHPFDEEIQAVALAKNERCLAVLTTSKVSVLDSAGALIWDTALLGGTPESRSVSPDLAISGTCDWVAAQTPHGFGVQVLRRDGLRRAVAVSDPAVDHTLDRFPGATSLDISPAGDLLAIGTAPSDDPKDGHPPENSLMLVSGDGEVVRRIVTSDLGEPVFATFAPDGKRLVMSTAGDVGVMDLRGSWQMHVPVEIAAITDMEATRDLRWFFGTWMPAHGPACTELTLLDRGGRPKWSKGLSDGGGAIAPDGSFFAYFGVDQFCDDPAYVANPDPTTLTQVWTANTSGRTLARRRLNATVVRITAQACVLTEERSTSPSGDNLGAPEDLIARDRSLREIRRLPNWLWDGRNTLPLPVIGRTFWIRQGAKTVSAYAPVDCSRH